MSGCHVPQCGCDCHKNGYKTLLMVNPPKVCCECIVFGGQGGTLAPLSGQLPLSDFEEPMTYKQADDIIVRLEKAEQLLHNFMESVNSHIEQLQRHKNYQIDKNIESFRRIDELEKENKMRQDTIACVDKAYNEAYRKIEKRLIEIERYQEIVHAQYKVVINKSQENDVTKLSQKQPFRCSVCAGKGNAKTEVEPMVLKFELCNACQGKGIVWG